MNEETRIDTPETNTEALNDEKLEEAAGGIWGNKSFGSLYGGRCPICGEMTCEHRPNGNAQYRKQCQNRYR